MKMQPWFKTLLVIVAVVAPMVWLMFTADGQRRTDAVMLQLFGNSAMEMDLAVLYNGISEQDLSEVYPQLQWQCGGIDGDVALVGGGRRCAAVIGSWNGMPAYRIAFEFGNGQLKAMQMDYRPAYHQQLLTQLGQQLGRPSKGSGAAFEDVLQWPSPRGLVLVKEQLQAADQAALMWVASR